MLVLYARDGGSDSQILFHARICHRQLLTHVKSLRYLIKDSSFENDSPGRRGSHDKRSRETDKLMLQKQSLVKQKLPVRLVYATADVYAWCHMIRIYDDAERQSIYQNVQFFILISILVFGLPITTLKYCLYTSLLKPHFTYNIN